MDRSACIFPSLLQNIWEAKFSKAGSLLIELVVTLCTGRFMMIRPSIQVDLDHCHLCKNLGSVPCPLPHLLINHQASHQEGHNVPGIILILNCESLYMRSFFRILSDIDDTNKYVLYLTWVLENSKPSIIMNQREIL